MATKVSEVMTREVELAAPDDTIQTAAKTMADTGAGALPVGENDRLVGMITDRDIAIRGAAVGKSPQQTAVREVMTSEVRYIFEDEDVGEVARKMAEWQVRRLPVLNRDKRLVGIISLGDLAFEAPEEGRVDKAMQGIAQPTGTHEQSAEPAYAGQKPQGGKQETR
jgi:CBS domain-containing protein